MKNNWLYIPEINKDVEVNVHDKGKSFNKLKQIYGKDVESKLLSKEEVETIQKLPEVSKILKMDCLGLKDDFYIKQYDEELRKKGLVAYLYIYSDLSGLYCNEYSGHSDSYRGVRFCREHIKGTPKVNESNPELIIEEIKINGRTYRLVEE
jgi:hypothetical protein